MRSHRLEPPLGAGNADPMRLTNARMDAEASARKEMARYVAEVADARAICRGIRDANPMHLLWGDCIKLHFVDLMAWRQVGAAMGVTESGARQVARAGLEWVDMVGIASARKGLGGA